MSKTQKISCLEITPYPVVYRISKKGNKNSSTNIKSKPGSSQRTLNISELVYFRLFTAFQTGNPENTSILSIVFKWKLQPWAQVLLSLIVVVAAAMYQILG